MNSVISHLFEGLPIQKDRYWAALQSGKATGHTAIAKLKGHANALENMTEIYKPQ